MTHEDAVEALRALVRSEAGEWLLGGDVADDAASRLLLRLLAPENREAVLRAFGMERLGCFSPILDAVTHRDLGQIFDACGGQHEPVYVYRGNP